MKNIDLKDIKLKKIFKGEAQSYLKLAQWIIIIIVVLGFAGAGWFLYQNVYRTVTQAEQILVLRRQVALETIESDDLEKVLTSIEAKKLQKEINWADINDPFILLSMEE